MELNIYSADTSQPLPQVQDQDNKNESISKIIDSYESLLQSLNQKIGQMTTDLELTRQKLGITETRYTTLLSVMSGSQQVKVEHLLDKIDRLEKKLINQNAEMNRCKAKLLQNSILKGEENDRRSYIQKSNVGKYFNFECIRQDEAIFSRKRKNSAEEQYNSVPWQKAFEQFADDASSPTKFKQKTISILKKFIPHQQRSKVWPFIFQNQLGITNTLYVELIQRKQKNPIEEHVKSQIERDIMRSFNNKLQLSNREALGSNVQEILQIFHLLRPDISYVQGMTYPVIILTVVVGKINAFRIFSNLILCNKFFRNMYTFEDKSLQIYCMVFESLLKESFPEVSKHLETLKIKSQIFIIEWFFTIFSRGLSLETTLKIWDMVGYQRQAVLYRVCLAIFELIGKRLLSQNYEETVGLIQSYWSYVDQSKLLDLTVNSKLTNEKLSKLFSKVTKAVLNIGRE